MFALQIDFMEYGCTLMQEYKFYYCMVYGNNRLVMDTQRVTASNLGRSYLVLGLKANPSI